MKFKRRRKAHGGVEAGALSDILFFLLLFFLMISTLASPEAIKILLPKAQNSTSVPPKHILNVSINDKLQYFVDKQEINPNMLKSYLEAEAAKKENTTLVIRIDKTVPVQEFINVIDMANKVKIPVVVATDKK